MSNITPTLLEQRLSAPRLTGYVSACNGNLVRAVALYEWNSAVSSAFFELLGDVEVVLRNALHGQLEGWHGTQAGTWYDDTAGVLTVQARQDIAKARQRIAANGKAETPGRVVAELNFGFWRFLMTKRYKPSLWRHALRHAFPNMTSPDPRYLFWAAANLHDLRNRVAHHEPVHRRNLTVDLRHCDEILSAICQDTSAWSASRSRVLPLLGQRP